MKVSLETFQGRFDLTQKIGDQFLLYQTLYASHLKISKLLKKAGKKEVSRPPYRYIGRRCDRVLRQINLFDFFTLV